MPIYAYHCERCKRNFDVLKPMSESGNVEKCPVCRIRIKRIFNAIISGTRDQFGIRNEFYDPKTKTYIDTRRKWEKAGFKDPLETTTNSKVRAGIKRKREKIFKYDSGAKKHFS